MSKIAILNLNVLIQFCDFFCKPLLKCLIHQTNALPEKKSGNFRKVTYLFGKSV